MLDIEMLYYLNKDKSVPTKKEAEIKLILAKQKVDDLLKMINKNQS